jgi:hypothetical protein
MELFSLPTSQLAGVTTLLMTLATSGQSNSSRQMEAPCIILLFHFYQLSTPTRVLLIFLVSRDQVYPVAYPQQTKGLSLSALRKFMTHILPVSRHGPLISSHSPVRYLDLTTLRAKVSASLSKKFPELLMSVRDETIDMKAVDGLLLIGKLPAHTKELALDLAILRTDFINVTAAIESSELVDQPSENPQSVLNYSRLMKLSHGIPQWTASM